MSLQIFRGQNTNTIWFLVKDEKINTGFDIAAKKNMGYMQLGSFSSSTNWEKVFALGDTINRNLTLSEKDIVDELSNFRKSKKR